MIRYLSKAFCFLAFFLVPLFSYDILIENADTLELGYGLHWRHDLNGEADILKEVLKPGAVVIDGGANIGAWSKAALATNASPRIHAFEPVPVVFEECVKNLQGTSVTLVNQALSDHDGKLERFCIYGKTPDDMQTCSCHVQPNLGAPDAQITIEQTTLDSYCMRQGIRSIDYLKLDVEGHELFALRGASNLLKDRAIRGIQFEYGFPFRGSRATLKEIFSLLHGHGYLIFRIFPGGCVYLPVWSDRYEDYRFSNFYAVLPSALNESWLAAIHPQQTVENAAKEA